MIESIKNDRKDNKVMMKLRPWEELEEVGKVFTAGANKYGPNRWQHLPDGYQRYKGAMLRHIIEVEKGNVFDKETGCMHAAQVVWNALAMLILKWWNLKWEERRNSYDDNIFILPFWGNWCCCICLGGKYENQKNPVEERLIELEYILKLTKIRDVYKSYGWIESAGKVDEEIKELLSKMSY